MPQLKEQIKSDVRRYIQQQLIEPPAELPTPAQFARECSQAVEHRVSWDNVKTQAMTFERFNNGHDVYGVLVHKKRRESSTPGKPGRPVGQIRELGEKIDRLIELLTSRFAQMDMKLEAIHAASVEASMHGMAACGAVGSLDKKSLKDILDLVRQLMHDFRLMHGGDLHELYSQLGADGVPVVAGGQVTVSRPHVNGEANVDVTDLEF